MLPCYGQEGHGKNAYLCVEASVLPTSRPNSTVPELPLVRSKAWITLFTEHKPSPSQTADAEVLCMDQYLLLQGGIYIQLCWGAMGTQRQVQQTLQQ